MVLPVALMTLSVKSRALWIGTCLSVGATFRGNEKLISMCRSFKFQSSTSLSSNTNVCLPPGISNKQGLSNCIPVCSVFIVRFKQKFLVIFVDCFIARTWNVQGGYSSSVGTWTFIFVLLYSVYCWALVLLFFLSQFNANPSHIGRFSQWHSPFYNRKRWEVMGQPLTT